MNQPEPVVVVGGGVLGLLSAVACAKAGAAVSVLDQGPIPNPDASSSDEHRIVRALHLGDPVATRRAVTAQHAWQALEHELGERFYHPIGVLSVLSAEQLALDPLAALRAAGGRGELLGPAELARRWPQLRFAAGLSGLLEPDAGVVLADRALAALSRWLLAHPRVRLCPRRRVVGVEPESGSLRIAGDMAVRGRILLTAGAWSRTLLPAASAAELTLHRQSLLYCEVPADQRAGWARTPAVLSLDPVHGAWLVPPVAGTHLKLSAASACRTVSEVTDHTTAGNWREHLGELMAGTVHGFDPSWVVGARDCYYLADAASGGARLIELGQGPTAVWSHAACGGGAFKFAPLIAESLAERVLGAARPPAFATARVEELDD